jgi:hypothetical protein
MAKTIAAIVGAIIFTGLIAGIFFGTSLKTGQDVDPDSVIVNVLGIFCDSFKNLDNGVQTYSTCRTSFILVTIVAFVAGILEIFATAKTIGNIYVGLTLYGFGFLIGVGLIFS